MTSEQIKALKASIDALFESRLGKNKAQTTGNDWRGANYGSLSGKSTAFSVVPRKGGPVLYEHGDKTVNLLKEKFYSVASENCGDKKNATEMTEIQLDEIDPNKPIPSDFDYDKLNRIVKKLQDEQKSSNGVDANTLGRNSSGSSVEASSCRAACSGICVGSCIGFCNTCTSCTGSCETDCGGTCTKNCTSNCKDSCTAGCGASCSNTCAGNVKGTYTR